MLKIKDHIEKKKEEEEEKERKKEEKEGKEYLSEINLTENSCSFLTSPILRGQY